MTSNGSSIGRLAVRNTVWLTIFSYASQFVAFVATIILTRLLGPEVFGLFAIGMFWTGLLALRTKFGLAGACIRQPELNGELLGSYYGLDLAISGLSLVLGIVAACLLPQLGYAPQVSYVVVVMMIVEALPALVNPLSLALEKELQLSRLTMSALVATIISYGLGIILALAGAGLWSLLVMSLVNAILIMAGTYLVCRWRLPAVFHLRWRFTHAMAKRLVKQGLPGGLANLGIVNIVNQYDNFLIGTLVSTTTLGYYDRAYRLSQWPNVMIT
jgi:O-antigen/teichoic acid export membrane protein